jgi:hypothetical protein
MLSKIPTNYRARHRRRLLGAPASSVPGLTASLDAPRHANEITAAITDRAVANGLPFNFGRCTVKEKPRQAIELAGLYWLREKDWQLTFSEIVSPMLVEGPRLATNSLIEIASEFLLGKLCSSPASEGAQLGSNRGPGWGAGRAGRGLN